MSEWEQRASDGEYKGMCNRCATRRLSNPWSGLLDMRRVKVPADHETGGET